MDSTTSTQHFQHGTCVETGRTNTEAPFILETNDSQVHSKEDPKLFLKSTALSIPARTSESPLVCRCEERSRNSKLQVTRRWLCGHCGAESYRRKSEALVKILLGVAFIGLCSMLVSSLAISLFTISIIAKASWYSLIRANIIHLNFIKFTQNLQVILIQLNIFILYLYSTYVYVHVFK